MNPMPRNIGDPDKAEIPAPLVSVVTVSFNALAGLKETVASVASQKGCSVEHVIVDGASTDGTPGFLASRDPSLRWISEPDKGIYDALNKAVRLAKGDYVLTLNAGDTFLNSESLAQAALYLDGAADIVAFDVEQTDGKKATRHSHGSPMRRLGLKTPFPHQSCFIRRELFARIGMYDESYRITADYDFELRAIRKGCAVKRVPVTLSTMLAGGISSRQDRAALDARFAEERRVQFAHSPNAAYTLFLRGFWPLYLGYRSARRFVGTRNNCEVV
jgi:glycosyltransferase involved in cell wall biosynthesis